MEKINQHKKDCRDFLDSLSGLSYSFQCTKITKSIHSVFTIQGVQSGKRIYNVKEIPILKDQSLSIKIEKLVFFRYSINAPDCGATQVENDQTLF
jgi:hypothetical protein